MGRGLSDILAHHIEIYLGHAGRRHNLSQPQSAYVCICVCASANIVRADYTRFGVYINIIYYFVPDRSSGIDYVLTASYVLGANIHAHTHAYTHTHVRGFRTFRAGQSGAIHQMISSVTLIVRTRANASVRKRSRIFVLLWYSMYPTHPPNT